MESTNNNLSEHELSVAAWLLYHKNGVRKLSLSILFGLLAITWGYFFYTLLDTTLLSHTIRNRATSFLTAPSVPLAAFHTSASPADLIMSDPRTTSQSGVLTTIQNPNTDWVARIHYSIPGTKKQTTTSIAPADTAYIFSSADDASIAVDKSAILWQHISKSDVPDIEAYKKARRNFVIKDPKYAADIAQDKKTVVYHVSFTATNATSWSYWQVPMLVLVYQGDRVAAALQTVFDTFTSGETRNADIVLPAPLGGVSSVEVIPQIDMFDPSASMPLPQAVKTDIGS